MHRHDEGESSMTASDEPPRGPVLVTDFDGTLTRFDFYRLVLERLVSPGTPDYWGEYLAGRITHFEAIQKTFAAAPAGESALVQVADAMELEPDLSGEIAALQTAGWRVVVASAGCRWYIDRLLARAGVADLPVHANPGRIESDRLVMRPPTASPFYSPATGIDKAAIVRDAIAKGGPVAFAGDGPPDLEPALLVEPNLRFARGHLAESMDREGLSYRPFRRWSEVSRAILAEGNAR